MMGKLKQVKMLIVSTFCGIGNEEIILLKSSVTNGPIIRMKHIKLYYMENRIIIICEEDNSGFRKEII